MACGEMLNPPKQTCPFLRRIPRHRSEKFGRVSHFREVHEEVFDYRCYPSRIGKKIPAK